MASGCEDTVSVEQSSNSLTTEGDPIQLLRAKKLRRFPRKDVNNIYKFVKLIYNKKEAEPFIGSDMSPLHYCAMEDDNKTFQLLIKKGANINHLYGGMSVLQSAVMSGSVECVKLLSALLETLPTADELRRYKPLDYNDNAEKKLQFELCLLIVVQEKDKRAQENSKKLVAECERTTEAQNKKKRTTQKVVMGKDEELHRKDDCTPLEYACMGSHTVSSDMEQRTDEVSSMLPEDCSKTKNKDPKKMDQRDAAEKCEAEFSLVRNKKRSKKLKKDEELHRKDDCTPLEYACMGSHTVSSDMEQRADEVSSMLPEDCSKTKNKDPKKMDQGDAAEKCEAEFSLVRNKKRSKKLKVDLQPESIPSEFGYNVTSEKAETSTADALLQESESHAPDVPANLECITTVPTGIIGSGRQRIRPEDQVLKRIEACERTLQKYMDEVQNLRINLASVTDVGSRRMNMEEIQHHLVILERKIENDYGPC